MSSTLSNSDTDARLRTRVAAGMPVVRALIDSLYGSVADPDTLCERLIRCVTQAAHDRKDSLRELDARREADSAWFQRPDVIGYVAYADRLGGTFAGVADRLDYLSELNVSYLHLMKVLKHRDGPNDGGYAVVDYGDVEPSLGTRNDLEELIDGLRDRGISLCLDLVLNHTAREHHWAKAARDGSAHYRDYYLVFPDRTMPDAFEMTLPEVFPEMAPGNFTWDDDLAGWVWTTFNTYQWDLNYANPDVFVEMLSVMLDLANLGVEVLRLDAIAFTWKRLGTNCQNQPEAHLLAQAYRALLAMAVPGTLLKAEAIVAPDDLVPYLGAHRLQRRECQLAYHNQLMVMIWASLATGDAALATQALGTLTQTPADTSFVTYLRCHDDIGWAVDDADAARVGIDGVQHRRFLAQFYRGAIPGSYARGAAFSINADTGDERTSGGAAALAGVSAARLGDAGGDGIELGPALRRLILGYGIVMGFGGIPLIYMGDEVALDDDHRYLTDPFLADDSRWMHRPHMDWSLVERRLVDDSIEQRVFAALKHQIAVRSQTVAMSAGGDTWFHRMPDTRILGWERRHPRHGRFYGLANVSASFVDVPNTVVGWAGLDQPVEVLQTGDLTVGLTTLTLAPYGMAWFVDQADTPVLPVAPT